MKRASQALVCFAAFVSFGGLDCYPLHHLRQRRDATDPNKPNSSTSGGFFDFLPTGPWIGTGSNWNLGQNGNMFGAQGSSGLNLFGNNVFGKQEGFGLTNSSFQYQNQGSAWNNVWNSGSAVNVDWSKPFWKW